jgi:acetylornithine/N-succinyldiaminopimelate aminotransferase
MNFSDLKQIEEDNIMQTYARFPVAIDSGMGAVAKDIDGKEYIDFGSGIGVNSLGFAHPDWVKAVSEQAGKLAHISNLYYNPIQIELASLLTHISGFDKVFLCNSGAEANEGAIKLARKYSFDKYGIGRATIITLNNSFHGRTITTLAATGQESFHNYFFPFTEGFRYADPNIESLVSAIDDTVCAIIIEGIQGEGGVLPLDNIFARKAAEIAKEKDILLIFDEVQTGIGRTGKMFSFEHFGLVPDIITCAKGLGGGLPIGAFLCSKELSNVLGVGLHGTTFGGNPVSCAGGIVVLQTISKQEFLNEVAAKGEYIKQRLKNNPKVTEIRGMGLMLGIDLKDGFEAKAIAAKCVENGLLILTAKTALRMLPPLVITYEEIDRGLAILESVLDEADK